MPSSDDVNARVGLIRELIDDIYRLMERSGVSTEANSWPQEAQERLAAMLADAANEHEGMIGKLDALELEATSVLDIISGGRKKSAD